MRGNGNVEKEKSTSLAATCASANIICLLVVALLITFLLIQNRAKFGDSIVALSLSFGLGYGIPAFFVLGLSFVSFAYNLHRFGKMMAAILTVIMGAIFLGLSPFMVITFNSIEFLISLIVIGACAFGLAYVTFRQIKEDAQSKR